MKSHSSHRRIVSAGRQQLSTYDFSMAKAFGYLKKRISCTYIRLSSVDRGQSDTSAIFNICMAGANSSDMKVTALVKETFRILVLYGEMMLLSRITIPQNEPGCVGWSHRLSCWMDNANEYGAQYSDELYCRKQQIIASEKEQKG